MILVVFQIEGIEFEQLDERQDRSLRKEHEDRNRVGGIGDQHEADEKKQVELKMPSFDVADLMGDDLIHLFRPQHLEQALGYQDVTKAGHQAHDAGRDHASAENWPVDDVRVAHSGFAAQGCFLRSCSRWRKA